MFVDWFKNVSANFVYVYEFYATNPLVTVPKAPITIGIIVTSMFHSFFNSLARSRYLSLFSHSFSFILWSAETAKSTILQIYYFYLDSIILHFPRIKLISLDRSFSSELILGRRNRKEEHSVRYKLMSSSTSEKARSTYHLLYQSWANCSLLNFPRKQETFVIFFFSERKVFSLIFLVLSNE